MIYDNTELTSGEIARTGDDTHLFASSLFVLFVDASAPVPVPPVEAAPCAACQWSVGLGLCRLLHKACPAQGKPMGQKSP
jgi:hypothetical protein